MNPEESAKNLPVGTVKKGLDGLNWITTKSGWKKMQNLGTCAKNCKQYFTHDNGARPFRVCVSQKQILVFRRNPEIEDDKDIPEYYPTLVAKFDHPKHVWIGTDENDDPFFRGNSILVQMNKQEFIFIGHLIYKFEIGPGEKVLKYKSRVGNSDVPYPFVKTNENTYFMIDYKYANNSYFQNDAYKSYFQDDTEDPYDILYAEHRARTNSRNHKQGKLSKNLYITSHQMKTKLIVPRN